LVLGRERFGSPMGAATALSVGDAPYLILLHANDLMRHGHLKRAEKGTTLVDRGRLCPATGNQPGLEAELRRQLQAAWPAAAEERIADANVSGRRQAVGTRRRAVEIY
jgi:hypothetical protein